MNSGEKKGLIEKIIIKNGSRQALDFNNCIEAAGLEMFNNFFLLEDFLTSRFNFKMRILAIYKDSVLNKRFIVTLIFKSYIDMQNIKN